MISRRGEVIAAVRRTQLFSHPRVFDMQTTHFLRIGLIACLCIGAANGNCDETATKKVVVNETLELIQGRNSNSFAVYSPVRRSWDSHSFPKHMTVLPQHRGEFGERAKDAVIAFALSGWPIEQLVAIDVKGRFRTFDLEDPLRREMRPLSAENSMIYYIADGVIYAFSGRTGTWDTLKAPHVSDVRWENGTGTPPDTVEHGFDSHSTGGIVVRLPRGTAIFSPDRGYWKIELASDPKTADDEPTDAPKHGPARDSAITKSSVRAR